MDDQGINPTRVGSGPVGYPPPGQGRDVRVEPLPGSGSVSPAPPPLPGAGRPEDAERMAKQTAEQIGQQARDLKDSAREGAAEAAGRAKDAVQQTAQQARAQAGRLAAQLREQGTNAIAQQKTRAADLLGDCVAATRRAAQRLHESNDHNLADYADTFAERLDSAGRYLRDQDARKIADDAADLARRRPEWVLGGAFVLGMAVARFLKASRPTGAAYGTYRYDDGYDVNEPYEGFERGGRTYAETPDRSQAFEGGLSAGGGGALAAGGLGSSDPRPYDPALSPGDARGTGGTTGIDADVVDVIRPGMPPTSPPASVTTTATGTWAAGTSPATPGTTSSRPGDELSRADRPEGL